MLSIFVSSKTADGNELNLCSHEKIPYRICKMNETYDNAKLPTNDFGLNCTVKVYDISDINDLDHTVTIYRRRHPNAYYLCIEIVRIRLPTSVNVSLVAKLLEEKAL